MPFGSPGFTVPAELVTEPLMVPDPENEPPDNWKLAPMVPSQTVLPAVCIKGTPGAEMAAPAATTTAPELVNPPGATKTYPLWSVRFPAFIPNADIASLLE